MKHTMRYSFQASLPVMAGYIVLGIGFGILLHSKGYGVCWAFAMSLFIYAGSMQYVCIDLLTAGASLITVAIMTVMVNIRHIFYGISMLVRYRDPGRARPYLIFALTDETFSLVVSPDLPEDVDEKLYYLLVSVLDHSYWVIGSVLGSIAGNIIPFDTTGIDFAMTALFIVIFLGQWESTREHRPALIGIAISVICLLVFGASSFLIPSMIGITIALFAIKPFLREEDL